MRDFNTGVSVVCSQDSDPASPDTAMYDNRTFAMDLHYQPFPELALEGLAAVSDTFVDSGDDHLNDALDGYALRLRCRTQGRPMRIGLE